MVVRRTNNVYPADFRNRIPADPPAQCGGVVAVAVIDQASFVIHGFGGEAVGVVVGVGADGVVVAGGVAEGVVFVEGPELAVGAVGEGGDVAVAVVADEAADGKGAELVVFDEQAADAAGGLEEVRTRQEPRPTEDEAPDIALFPAGVCVADGHGAQEAVPAIPIAIGLEGGHPAVGCIVGIAHGIIRAARLGSHTAVMVIVVTGLSAIVVCDFFNCPASERVGAAGAVFVEGVVACEVRRAGHLALGVVIGVGGARGLGIAMAGATPVVRLSGTGYLFS